MSYRSIATLVLILSTSFARAESAADLGGLGLTDKEIECYLRSGRNGVELAKCLLGEVQRQEEEKDRLIKAVLEAATRRSDRGATSSNDSNTRSVVERIIKDAVTRGSSGSDSGSDRAIDLIRQAFNAPREESGSGEALILLALLEKQKKEEEAREQAINALALEAFLADIE